jgi:hypothetical protein
MARRKTPKLARRKTRKMARAKQWHGQEQYDAHASAIGKIVIAWNQFQETLGETFGRFMGTSGYKQALAAWQSLQNDRAQREMLRAVAAVTLDEKSRCYQEINWALKWADRHLSGWRNLGIHTPVALFTDLDGITKMVPITLFGNRNAAVLHQKDLLQLFSLYEENIRKMNTYVVAINYHFSNPSDDAWPDRPQVELPSS